MRRVPGACSSSSRPRWRRLPIRCSRSEEHTSELQSLAYLVCRLLLEKKKKNKRQNNNQKSDKNTSKDRRAKNDKWQQTQRTRPRQLIPMVCHTVKRRVNDSTSGSVSK